ncbi:uracil phosphoribosyltransferase [Gossypium australe]|uniref:Uracil phosphoribosyltransferase n=1 Tax=Gossypium australe TaxID=47621 RepID=A0A5B6V3R4_9ROSI|nr:uracil phosphoribosyltransferase [Gossypium australe]
MAMGFVTMDFHIAIQEKPILGNKVLIIIRRCYGYVMEVTYVRSFKGLVELRMCFSIWNIKYAGWQPTVAGEIQSPLAITSVEFIDLKEPIVIVPILRASLTLAEHASFVFLATKTYHLGKKCKQGSHGRVAKLCDKAEAMWS